MDNKTVLIPQSDIRSILKMKDAITEVEKAFMAYGNNEVLMPAKVYLKFKKGDLRCMPSFFKGARYAGMKSVNVHPQNTILPSVMAVAVLTRAEDGFTAAIMDATDITATRTGAAGGIAAKYLARTNSTVAGFIGTGGQSEKQLEALLITRPSIKQVTGFDSNPARLMLFKKTVHRFGLEWITSSNIEEVARSSDILTTITPVTSPIIMKEWIKKGTHINAIGADATGKQELDSNLTIHSKVVIDSWEQASKSGEINVPVSENILGKNDIHAGLGEIVTGNKKGRTCDDEITVFDSTGLAIQDLACMLLVYNKYNQQPDLFTNSIRFAFF